MLAHEAVVGLPDLKEMPPRWPADAKTSFVRNVLAMANSSSSGESALIIVGVKHRRHGGAIVRAEKTLLQEAVAQVLATYTTR